MKAERSGRDALQRFRQERRPLQLEPWGGRVMDALQVCSAAKETGLGAGLAARGTGGACGNQETLPCHLLQLVCFKMFFSF